MSANYFQNKRVLVAGGAGFTGSNLILRLLALGARVRATYHNKPLRVNEPGLEAVQADLTQPEDCRKAVEGMDMVFMCAANTAGAAVMANTPLVHVNPNILMNLHMLEAAYRARVGKYVFISSGAAYPPTDDRPVREEEMFEADPYDVYYPVGWMKRYVEVLCRMYSEKLPTRMPCIVVRPSNLYGPYDKFDPQTSHMMAALLRRVANRENPFVVWGTGKDVRDLIYIDDYIDGLLLAAEKQTTYDPVNIAYGRAYSIRELIQKMFEVDKYFNAEVSFDASKPSMAPVRLFDTSKMTRLFGFKPKTSLEEGIRKTLAWYRENIQSTKVGTAS